MNRPAERMRMFAAVLILLLTSLPAHALEDSSSSRLIQKAYAEKPDLVNYARAQRALVAPMTNGRSFYLYWVPEGSKPPETKILVPLHGEKSDAFEEFRFWHKYADQRRFALLIPQWKLGLADGISEHERLAPYEAYGMVIESLLTYQKYEKGSAVLYGRGEGAELAYGIAALDHRKGASALISGAIVDDGPADLLKSPALEISSGALGLRVFDGIRWTLYCKTLCKETQQTAAWILFHAGQIALFLEEPGKEPGLREDDARLSKILSSLNL